MDLFSIGVQMDTTKVKQGERDLDSWTRATGRADKASASLVGTLTAVAAAVGGVTAAMKSVDVITRFEDAMLGLQATIGGTAQQMAVLEDQARSLGATSVFSAEQAAQAQRFLAMSGMQVNDILSVTPSVLRLATAGALDLASAADIATNVMGGFGLGVGEFNRVGDVLANTARSGNLNIGELAEALSYSATIAKTAGVSIETTTAALASLADNALKGSRGGTGLAGVIRQLSNVTPAAEEALAKYGISISDVNIQQRGLIPVLETLEGRITDVGDMFTIFGSEAGVAAGALLNTVGRIKEVSESNREATGTMKDMADTMGSGLSSSFKSLQSQVSESILQLGDSGLAGALKDVTDAATGVLAVYNDMLPEFAEANELTQDQADSLTRSAGYIKAYAGAIGGASAGLALYTSRTWLAAAATRGLTAAMTANPVGLALVALGTAAGLYLTIGENAQTASEAVDMLNTSTANLTETQKENARVSINARLVQLQAELEVMKEQEEVLNRQAEAGAKVLYVGRSAVGGVEAVDDTKDDITELEAEIAKLEKALDKIDGKTADVSVSVDVTPEFNDLLDAKKIGVDVAPEVSSASKSAWKQYYGIMAQEMQPEVEEALSPAPSDFAMSIGNALASQDYSSFGNILASQAAGSIGAAVTDAIGGSLGGVAGGLIGGAAGSIISQAISNYMEDDLIALERQASQGTGTVLGSIDAKSQSIANSMAYMTDGLDDLIGINTEGFKSMQALVDSIGGASSLLARDFDASGIASGLGLSGLGSITQDFGGIVDDFFGGLTGGLFESVFGGIGGALFGRSKVSDEGINLLSGTIAELIDNDVTQAYQTVTKKSLFSSSRKTSYRFAGDAIEQQFDLTLEAMRDAVTASAESLGMLPSEIQANLDAFTIEAQKISIKDLSADEVADELEAVFSSIFDNLSSSVVPYVSDFQEAGEGAGETLSRLSTNLSVVDEALSQLRLSDLQGTTQEVLTLSEGFVDFFGDASGLATAFTGFVGEFATQERQLEILTGNLTEALGDQDLAILNSRDGVYDYIASLQQLDGDNVERIANILSLTDSLDDYFDLIDESKTATEDANQTLDSYTASQLSLSRQYMTDAQIMTSITDELTDAFGEYGLVVPTSREQFLALAQSIDVSTESGREAFDALNGVSGSFDKLMSNADSVSDNVQSLQLRLYDLNGEDGLAKTIRREEERSQALSDGALGILEAIYKIEDYNEALDNQADMLSRQADLLESNTDSAFAVLRKSIQQQQDILSDAYDDDREAIQGVLDGVGDSISDLSGVADSLKNAIEQTVDISATAARMRLVSARQQIAAFADSGILPDADTLDDLLSTVTGDNAQYYKNAEDYYREQGRAANDIAFLSELADGQLTEAERAQKTAEAQLEALEDQYDLDREALSSQLDYWTDQIDISRNTYIAATDILSAIQNLQFNLSAEEQGTSGYTSEAIRVEAEDIFARMTSSGSTEDDAYLAIGQRAINEGVSSAELARALGVSRDEVLSIAGRVGLPAFANGGVSSNGGMALVGERGPEIINMPAGTHTSNANDTKRMMNDPKILAALEAILAEEKLTKQYSKNSYDILNRVSNGGNSFAVDAAIVADITGA